MKNLLTNSGNKILSLIVAAAIILSAAPITAAAQDNDTGTPGASVCVCETLCGEDSVNAACPVCVEDYAGCAYAAAPVASPGVTITIAEGEFGDAVLRLTEGKPITDADLLVGVSAEDENGDTVPVTVGDMSGLDLGNPQMRGAYPNPPYVITYAAVHPVTGEVFTQTRELYVTLGGGAIIAVSAGGAYVDNNGYIVFPDQNFKNALLAAGIGENGEITPAQAVQVTKLNLENKGISSLDGIEYFTAITELSCRENNLTALDLSYNTALKKLNCNENPLTTLNVSKCTDLEELYCSYNQLTTLDVSQNTDLKALGVAQTQLTALDVSKNTALEELRCNHNKLTTLDVRNNIELEELVCGVNQLTTLDVSNNPKLRRLSVGSSDERDNPGTIKPWGNRLTTLDIRNNPALYYFDCGNNLITSITFGNHENMYGFYCAYNQLTELNVSKFPKLETLECGGNLLTELDVSKNTGLEDLRCDNNQLTGLDVGYNTALTELDCSSNELTELDVSKNTKLTELDCSSNKLTTLDVSKNTALTKLNCRYNLFADRSAVIGFNGDWDGNNFIFEPQKTVTVGAQTGMLKAGTAGSVTFQVTTLGITDGDYDVTVDNLPDGVIVSGRVAINNSSGTLMLAGDITTMTGTTDTLTLTIDGVTSAAFALTISPAYAYTVTFMNGSTVHATKTVISPDTTIDALPPDPTNGSYTFSGWYTGTGGSGTKFDAETPVISDMTVYAYWTGGGDSGDGGGGSGDGGGGSGNGGGGGSGDGGGGSGDGGGGSGNGGGGGSGDGGGGSGDGGGGSGDGGGGSGDGGGGSGDGGGDPSGGGSSSSGRDRDSGGSIPAPAVSPMDNKASGALDTAINEAVNAAADAAASTASNAGGNSLHVTLKNVSDFTKANADAIIKKAKELGIPAKVSSDVMSEDGKSVEVRITVNPALITQAVKLDGYIRESQVRATAALFDKFFENKTTVVHLGQDGTFGQTARVAAKVDLAEFDSKNLYFYAYDKKTNSYKRIENPAYRIDSNGYLHFDTDFGGDIIISENPLERKRA